MQPVYVIGVGMTPFGVLEDGLVGLAEAAAIEAINDSGASEESFDRVIVGTQNPDEFTDIGHLSTLMADRLGLVPAGATRVETGPSSGASAFETAFSLVRASMADLILVIGVEKMSSVQRGKASRILAKMMSQENETRYGATPAALAAMVARSYMHKYGLTRDELSLIPVKAHKNGMRNPLAHFQKEVTIEKVSNARMIADPLTLYDICPTSDGAAAVVVCSEQFLRGLGLPDAIQAVGVGHATDYHAVQHRLEMTSMNATIEAAQNAFEMADLTPKKVDVCEIHDAFSILELVNMEDIGLANRGESIELVKNGTTSVDGSLPVNTTGGLKARGHPTGATGIAQIRDIVLQLQERHEKALQVDAPEIGLTHNIGGFGNNMLVCLFQRT